MAIDYSGLHALTAKDLMAALFRDGLSFVRQAGSHQRYKHPDGRRVTIAPHGRSGTFARKTLKTIIEDQAQWTEADLIRLGLLKR
jgi:predicted RNA binding protein YcfA (HicA-like mRNA interferase family)